MERLWLSLCCILLIPLIGCSRSLTGSSTLTIQVPKTFGKVGALALPSGRKACYGVSVTAADIPTQSANSCSPKTGILAGFVEPGQTISATVPKGTSRKIELYVFLEGQGEDTPCPKLHPGFSAAQLLNTYLVATKDGVDINQDEVTVDITMNFPGESQHLAQTLGLPMECTTVSAPKNPYRFSVNSSQGASTGSGIKLKARVGAVQQDTVLMGAGFKLYVQE